MVRTHRIGLLKRIQLGAQRYAEELALGAAMGRMGDPVLMTIDLFCEGCNCELEQVEADCRNPGCDCHAGRWPE